MHVEAFDLTVDEHHPLAYELEQLLRLGAARLSATSEMLGTRPHRRWRVTCTPYWCLELVEGERLEGRRLREALLGMRLALQNLQYRDGHRGSRESQR
jgi:hypothetical protein